MAARLTEFEEPTFSIRIKKSMCEVIPIILWDLKWLIPYTVIEVL